FPLRGFFSSVCSRPTAKWSWSLFLKTVTYGTKGAALAWLTPRPQYKEASSPTSNSAAVPTCQDCAVRVGLEPADCKSAGTSLRSDAIGHLRKNSKLLPNSRGRELADLLYGGFQILDEKTPSADCTS